MTDLTDPAAATTEPGVAFGDVKAAQLFDEFMQRTLAPVPKDMKDQRNAIESGFRKKFEKPPVAGAEQAVHRRLTAEQVRQMLFFPQAEDMRDYPALISCPPEHMPPTHPLYASQGTFITVLYMHHSRDPEFIHEFIRAGGLRALAELIGAPESHPQWEHIRGQALDIFFRFTGEEVVDWFNTPDDGSRPPDMDLRERLFELTKTPFLANLSLCYSHPLSGLALQIIAFFASWVRLFYCPDNKLRLSRELLALLEKWRRREDAPPDDVDLATRVFEDFNRLGPAEDAPKEVAAGAGGAAGSLGLPTAPDGSASGKPSAAGGGGGGEKAAAEPPAAGAAAAASAGGGGAAGEKKDWGEAYGAGRGDPEEDKKLGNAAFKAGKWGEAIEHYTLALDRLVPQEALLQCMPARAVYHTNRAAAYLARDVSPHGDESVGRHDDGDAARALLDANEAINYNGKYHKAHYRKAQALEKLGKLKEALGAAERAHELSTGPACAEMASLVARLGALSTGTSPAAPSKAPATSAELLEVGGGGMVNLSGAGGVGGGGGDEAGAGGGGGGGSAVDVLMGLSGAAGASAFGAKKPLIEEL